MMANSQQLENMVAVASLDEKQLREALFTIVGWHTSFNEKAYLYCPTCAASPHEPSGKLPCRYIKLLHELVGESEERQDLAV